MFLCISSGIIYGYFIQVDCTEAGKETCNKFSVTGYPTLKIFKDGELSKEYQGPREYGIVSIFLVCVLMNKIQF